MKLLACIAASLCGLAGMWLMHWREQLELRAGIEPIKAGGTISDEDGEG